MEKRTAELRKNASLVAQERSGREEMTETRPKRSVSLAVSPEIISPYGLEYERIEERAFSYPNIDEEISEIAADSVLDVNFASKEVKVRGKAEFIEQDYASHRVGVFPQAHQPLDLSSGSRHRKRKKEGSRTSLPELDAPEGEGSKTEAKLDKRPLSTVSHEHIPSIRFQIYDEDLASASSAEATDSGVPQQEFRRQVSQAPLVSRKFRSIVEESPERSQAAKTRVAESESSAGQEEDEGAAGFVKFHIGEESPMPLKRPMSREDSEAEKVDTRKKEERRDSHMKHHHHHHHHKRRSHHLLHPEDAVVMPRRRRGSDVHWDTYSEKKQDTDIGSGLTPNQQENVHSHRFEFRGGSQVLSPESYHLGHGLPSPIDNLRKRKRGELERDSGQDAFPQKFFSSKRFDHNPHELFVEMDQLFIPRSVDAEFEWKQTARWVKYEEDLEEGAERWGKPHMSSLSFHSLLELRKCIEEGSLLFDLEETDLRAIAEAMVDAMVQSDQILEEQREFILLLLLARHEHVNEHGHRLKRQDTYNSLDYYFYNRQQSAFSPMSNQTTIPEFDVRSPTDMLMRLRSVTSAQNGVSNGHLSMSELARRRKLSAPPPSMSRGPGRETSPSLKSDATVILHAEGEHVHAALLNESRRTGSSGFFGRLSANWDRLSLKRRGRRHRAKSGERHITSDIVKCLPEGVEAASVCVGAIDGLEKPAVVFVRLADPQPMPRVTEVSVPVRFIFVLLGPHSANLDYQEVGRSISTLLSNKRFHDAMYKSSVRQDVLHAINEFLDDSIVLPPGVCDKKDLLKFEEIANKQAYIRQRRRALTERTAAKATELDMLRIEEAEKVKADPLRRTKKPFGGLRREFSQRLKLYKSDFKDAMNIKCFSSVMFMFLSCFVPAITFGAILSQKTEGILGVEETIVATSVGGILFALFSAQPLMLIGVNGTLLIFEQSLFKFCKAYTINFLSVRVWVSVWGALFCVITVACEGSFLIRYVTRFSDDILNSLVSVIFVTECILFLSQIFSLHPVMHLKEYCEQNMSDTNMSESILLIKQNSSDVIYIEDKGLSQSDFSHNTSSQLPNTALLSTVLVVGTFILAYTFRRLRSSTFFGRNVRRMVADLHLSWAVILMGLFDWALNDESMTSKLNIRSNRFYVIADPLAVRLYVPFAMVLAGILFFLIIFVETEVGEMELSKKEHELRKGSGYHWDLILTGVLCTLCSVFGLPWICALSVQSMGHLKSLTKYQKAPPGQKPPVREVVEQRITGMALHVLIGMCLLFTGLLDRIPVAVLFGVFLYFGVTNMSGVQMLSRSLLMLIPVKYHPCHVYCLRVPAMRMHLYSAIQLVCFVFVVTIKSIKMTSPAFPLTVMVTVIVRQKFLPLIFTDLELLALDGEENVKEDGDSYEGRLPV